MAKPYAPLKELLSRMTNAPGSRSLRIQMAGTYKRVNASSHRYIPTKAKHCNYINVQNNVSLRPAL